MFDLLPNVLDDASPYLAERGMFVRDVQATLNDPAKQVEINLLDFARFIFEQKDRYCQQW